VGVFLVHCGRISAKTLSKSRRFFILAAFVASALLTPPDVLTQVILAAPLIVLYEVMILYAKLKQENRMWRMRKKDNIGKTREIRLTTCSSKSFVKDLKDKWSNGSCASLLSCSFSLSSTSCFLLIALLHAQGHSYRFRQDAISTPRLNS